MRLAIRIYRIPAAIAAITILTLAVAACGDADDDEAIAPATAAAARATAAQATAAQATAAQATAAQATAAQATAAQATAAQATAAQATAAQATAAQATAAQATAAQATAAQATGAPAALATAAQATAAPTAQSAAPRAAPAEQRPGPTDTTFRNYGRTPFVDADTDAVSTFSLDTDRTSYFLALNWAQNGYEVEPDSVRAEEWVNAFDYGYDLPRDERSFAITSEVVEHPLGGGRHLARVALQAPMVRDHTPLNVTLVLDASGSMNEGNRVAIAREAAETIRQSLSEHDRIAVVQFSSDVLRFLTVEHTRPDDRDVARSIARLAPGGSTNVQAGLNLGVRLADEARRERPDAFNYIILMSDGVANVDATNPFAILESAPDYDRQNPLRLITIGVGIANYNDYLLEQLAQHGNGWYRYLDDTAQARATFSRENWLALSTPFADQARAQVTWDPRAVQAWRIVGYENRITPDHTFEQNRREFAELPSGSATTVFYELVLRDAALYRSAVLGEIEARWVDPFSGDTLSQRLDVSGRTDAPFDAADRHFRLGAIVALAADRYSALSPQVRNAEVDAAGIHFDLEALLGELDLLGERLGGAQAYSDFRFLLDRLTAAAAELAPAARSGSGSGYSR